MFGGKLMKEETKRTIIGAVVGTAVTGVFSLGIFFLEKGSIEEKTVETLSDYFESVDKDMSYDEALKVVYQDQKELEKENETLTSELNELKTDVVEENKTTIKNAEDYAKSEDYAEALTLLNGIKDKSAEVEVFISDYTKKYEDQVVAQADNLLSEEKYDEAVGLIDEALTVIPDSSILSEKKNAVRNSLPQNMTEIVPAYQSGGNTYKEYCSSKSGGTETFSMGGVKYTDGMTFDADINVFNDVSWAIYNLGGNYKTLDFTVCHVDGTDNGDATSLQIFYDGELAQEIPLKPDMSPQKITIDITDVKQLKMQVPSAGGNAPLYGIGNPVLKS